MDTPPRHLRRLACVWERRPIYFLTLCTAGRSPILASSQVHAILYDEWSSMRNRHGWLVGRYVVMPDHVHFFTAQAGEVAKPLAQAIAKWKEWTARRSLALLAREAPFWQPGFFDHLLRSDESRSTKWAYVRENPVRAGLIAEPEEWPYAGSIDFE
jgi:putative transposase